MVGRIAIILCLAVHAAAACPPASDEAERIDALRSDDAGDGDESRGLAMAVGLMGLSTLLFAITRRNAARRTFATSRRKVASSAELARALARLQRPRAALLAITSAAAIPVIAQLSFDVATRVAWSVAPTALLAIAIATLVRLERVLAIRAEHALTTVAHNDFLYIARDGVLVAWIAAPARQVARATRMPIATALRL